MKRELVLNIALNVLITGMIYFIDLLVPLGVAGGVPYVISVIISFWTPKLKSSIIVGMIVSVLVIFGYLYSPEGNELHAVVLTNRILAFFVIWTTVFFVLKLKTTMNQLYQSEWRLNSAEKIAHIGHYEIAPDSGRQQWSDEMFQITGMPVSDGAPNIIDCLKRVCKDDRRRVLSEFRDRADDGKRFDITYCLKVNGERRIVHSIGRIQKKYGSNEKMMYGTLQDITEKARIAEEFRKLNVDLENRVKERTQRLEESQQLYKAVARNFPDGAMIVLDRDFKYVFAEGKEMSRLGVGSESVKGADFIERIPPECREELSEKLNNVYGGKDFSMELEINETSYVINAVGLHNSYGKVSQVLVVLQNIAKLKQAENDMRKALIKEKRLNNLKSRFVSMASHEFRTPLTTIQSSVSLLSKYIKKDTAHQNKKKKHLNKIQNSIFNITSILNDFLSLDQLEEGYIDLRPMNFDLPGFTEEVAEELKEGLKKGQHIQYGHKGKAEVFLDKNLLKNICDNLLSNAVKYSSEGAPITLSTSYLNGHVTIKVKDEGIGIPAADQEHLFERFFRAENTINIQGTGLGLNIVKKYVDMMDGEIDFESIPGEGSTFRVSIPVHIDE